MGFFDLFKKKEEAPPEEKETQNIDINEVSGWLNSILDNRLSQAKSQAINIHTEIINRFSEIKKSADALASATFEKDDKTYAAANMVKDSFVKKINSIVNNIPTIQGELNYMALKDSYSHIVDVLKDLKSASPKQKILLSNYFSRESNTVIGNIKEAEKQLDAFKKFLDSDAKVLGFVEDANLKIKEESNLLKQLKSLEDKENILSANRNELENRKSREASELENIFKSEEWAELNTLNEEIEIVKSRALDIKSRIEESLSAINRPLKKFEHLVNAGYQIPREQEDALKRFIYTPFKAIMLDSGESELKNVLNALNNITKEKRISLKPKEQERTLELIRKLGSETPWLKDSYKKLVKKESDKKRKVKEIHPDIINKKKELEDSIKQSMQELIILESEIKNVKTEKERIKEMVFNKKEGLEKLISENTNEKVNIKVL